MNPKKMKKETIEQDVEIPSLENEIKDWCEVPTEADDSKSADDMVIDAWCHDSSLSDKDTNKAKKEKK